MFSEDVGKIPNSNNNKKIECFTIVSDLALKARSLAICTSDPISGGSFMCQCQNKRTGRSHHGASEF